MANEVSFAHSAGLPSRESLAASLSNVAAALPSSGGEAQYLKMEKGTGEWLYGQEETLVDPDSLWAVNPHSIHHGWVAWDTDAGGAPVQEIMVPSTRPLPDQSALPPLPLGVKGNQLAYKQQRSVQLVCVSDPNGQGKDSDEGVLCEYKQSSVGAMRLFKDLIEQILERLRAGDDKIVPIVKLTYSTYKHDKWGRQTNPVFDFIEWRTLDDSAKPEAKAEEAAVDDEEAELEAEYKAAAAEADAPRRRARRD